MITEDYCSFEVAKLLKEKGFDGDCGDCECHMFYHEMTDRIMPIMEIGMIPDYDTVYFAPTHQMAMKWLREVHKLSIDICIVQGKRISYMFNIWDFSIIHNNKFIGGTFDLREQLYDFLTYEEAVEAALKYSLENLI